MVRVAIDARLLAYQQAGTATYVRGILGGLQASDGANDVLVVASRKDPDLASLGCVPCRLAWTPCHHPWERWALGLELATAPVDVVHSPDFIPPARLGRRWARVITVHDLAFLRFPELLTADSRRYYGQIGRAVEEADRIIAVSEATRRDLLERVSSAVDGKVVVIPEGVGPSFVPLDPACARERVANRFGVDRPYFLFVGTLEPRKNLRRLVRAFAAFRDRAGSGGPLLILAGARGWLEDGLMDETRPLGDAVRFLGKVGRDDLVPLYNAALALVLVSLCEGFGLPALEAMACGRPTLVSDVSSLPEVVGDAGLRVPPTDEEAIAAGLTRLWEDEALRADLGERGRRRAAQFDWISAARRTREVYHEAAACAS